MKSVIRQMFYGNRGYLDSIGSTDEYRKLSHELLKNEEEFIEKLAPYPELLDLYKQTIFRLAL